MTDDELIDALGRGVAPSLLLRDLLRSGTISSRIEAISLLRHLLNVPLGRLVAIGAWREWGLEANDLTDEALDSELSDELRDAARLTSETTGPIDVTSGYQRMTTQRGSRLGRACRGGPRRRR
jgi:hypothetical protein